MDNLEYQLALSNELHCRVQAFATRSLSRVGKGPEEFVRLACDIAEFQRGEEFNDLNQLVRSAVPADCFRFGARFQFPVSSATHRFVTSGTTGRNSGVHYLRSVHTYEWLSLLAGERALGLDNKPSPVIIALAPWTGRNTASSLGYMMQRMMERFDGRGLSVDRLEADFRLEDPMRWLVSERRISLPGLRAVTQLAHATGTKIVLLATSFALVELLDALNGVRLPLPSGSVVMPTGGFKGRTRTIEPDVMESELRRTLGDVDLVGEYGMTELTSQLYEGTRRDALLRAPAGIYLEPPWLRVVPCCPLRLTPVDEGEMGLACFIDLGNIDSAVAMLTHDLVRREAGGIRLLGRQPSAPLRGCSLAIEALMRSGRRIEPSTAGATPSPVPGGAEVNDVDNQGELCAARERIGTLAAAADSCRTSLCADDEALEAIAQSSHMSVPGVKLVLNLALETTPSSAEVELLLSRARALLSVNEHSHRATTWVVLSATVFTAAHRAIALALSITPHVKVKPSRRQTYFAERLGRAAHGLFEVVDTIRPRPGDTVLAFGSDETLQSLRSQLPDGVLFSGHGHGMGVAIVGPDAELEQSAKALALDMVLFEQQGCLSPRLVLLDNSFNSGAFVEHLLSELTRWATIVPPATPTPEDEARAAWERRVAEMLGGVKSVGPSWVVEYEDSWCQDNTLPLTSTPRTISLVRTVRPLDLLEPIRSLVTCVGFVGDGGLAQTLAAQCSRARLVPLGMMQRPAFDGPVDLRAC